MKKILFFTGIFCALLSKGQQIDYSMKCFQSAMNELNMNDLVAADSLFSLSIYLKPSAEAYMNRAKIRYYYQDMIGYCSDLYNASKMGDSQASQLYIRRCPMYDPEVQSINQIVKPQTLPEFDIFYGKMDDYIAEYLIFPAEAKYSNIKGNVIVSCIISAEGKPESVHVVKGIGHGCDEEAVRLVSSMPLWIPATNTDSDGNTVNIPWKTEITVQFK